MGCTRAIICIICPPLAVLDQGCGSVLIVTVLWCFGLIPGIIAALVICNSKKD